MATTPTGTTSSSSPGLRLRRSLTLWDLILYGIIVIQPTAPMPAYRVFSNAGGGHVGTSILIAMIAMVFPAMSYGRIAPVYPSMADGVCSNLAAPVGDVNSSRFGQSISPGRRSLRSPTENRRVDLQVRFSFWPSSTEGASPWKVLPPAVGN
jgi:hypothetical protein